MTLKCQKKWLKVHHILLKIHCDVLESLVLSDHLHHNNDNKLYSQSATQNQSYKLLSNVNTGDDREVKQEMQ